MSEPAEKQRQQQPQARSCSVALQAEEEDRLWKEKRDRWRREGMYLSSEELAAGQPCRSCGRPFIDDLGPLPPLAEMAPEDRSAYEAENAQYWKLHADCRGIHWTVRGSRTQHCSNCCPPPPRGDEQAKAIAKILFSKLDVRDLDDWDVTLTCNHVVRGTKHRQQQRYSATVENCPACETRRGVVSAVHIGPAADPDRDVRLKRAAEKERRQRLAVELRTAEVKRDKHRKAMGEMEQRVAEINEELRGAEDPTGQ